MPDRRRGRSCGRYSTRHELNIAVKFYSKNLTLKEVAMRTGVSESTVQRITKGDKPSYRVATLREDNELPSNRLNRYWITRNGERHESTTNS